MENGHKKNDDDEQLFLMCWGTFGKFIFIKERVELHFFVISLKWGFHFNFVSMTTPRYLAESVSEMGVL